jgi:hypothetical protein
VSEAQGAEPSREEQTARARPEVMFLNRLEVLERDNRRLQRSANLSFIGIAILLGLVVALVWVAGRYGMPGSVAREVAARQFVLRDQSGTLRGVWGMGEDGAVRLVLQDQTGRPRVKVSMLAPCSRCFPTRPARWPLPTRAGRLAACWVSPPMAPPISSSPIVRARPGQGWVWTHGDRAPSRWPIR